MNDPRVDTYIERAEDFARPILLHLRDLVHQCCPDACEAIKWGAPHFVLSGSNLAGMASFKKHVTFGFWPGLDVVPANYKSAEAMGDFGKITAISDLPSDEEMANMLKRAAAIIKSGDAPKLKRAKKLGVVVPPMPDDFSAAIAANPDAQKTYDAFPPGYQRDYIQWIVEAKRDATRQKRITTAVEWMAEGKDRNWKYR